MTFRLRMRGRWLPFDSSDSSHWDLFGICGIDEKATSIAYASTDLITANIISWNSNFFSCTDLTRGHETDQFLLVNRPAAVEFHVREGILIPEDIDDIVELELLRRIFSRPVKWYRIVVLTHLFHISIHVFPPSLRTIMHMVAVRNWTWVHTIYQLIMQHARRYITPRSILSTRIPAACPCSIQTPTTSKSAGQLVIVPKDGRISVNSDRPNFDSA